MIKDEMEEMARNICTACHNEKGKSIDGVCYCKSIVSALRQVRERTILECAEIAENAFMNEVLPKHTAVRDFIADAIRKLGEKSERA